MRRSIIFLSGLGLLLLGTGILGMALLVFRKANTGSNLQASSHA